jgi:septal ring factor EnvC (AmiA/AmiB activator)
MADKLDSQPNAAGEVKQKTPAQLKKEQEKAAKNAAKLAKFEEKQRKLKEEEEAKKNKEQKKEVKTKTVVEYTANTELGEKKGILF